jgi:hypothetical protein
MPRPPQTAGAAQAPQSMVAPQPSPIWPQKAVPAAVQVSGTQLGATQTPPTQFSPLGQAPQSNERPQPSPTLLQ